MKDGKLLEDGSHAALMKLGKEYKEMYNASSAPNSHKKEIACQTSDEEPEKEGDGSEKRDETREPTAEVKVKTVEETSPLAESAVLVTA